MNLEVVGMLRSLGGGGLLGGGVAALLHLLVPGLFPATVTVEVIASIGGIAGAGLHYYISAVTDWLLFRSLVKFRRVYGRLILALPLFPFMTPEQRTRILGASVDELALPLNDKQQLPALPLPAPERLAAARQPEDHSVASGTH